MANNIVLKTFRGGSVTPLDDAIIQQTVIGTNGIFKGCKICSPIPKTASPASSRAAT